MALGLIIEIVFLELFTVIPGEIFAQETQEASPGAQILLSPSPFIPESSDSAQIRYLSPTPTPQPIDISPSVTPSITSPPPIPTSIPTLLDFPASPSPEITVSPTRLSLPSASIRQAPKLRALPRKHFSASDLIEFYISNTAKDELSFMLKDARGFDINIKSTFSSFSEGTRLSLVPSMQMKPGKYKLTVNHQTTGEKLEQDFLWGVLAINPDQSVYRPGDSASLAIAVLDDYGNMVCDADITLSILDPQNNREVKKTSDGTITVNSACRLHDFTPIPDYETAYVLKHPGEYLLDLTAATPNGTFHITDKISADANSPFYIRRKSNTRLFPPRRYPMEIEIEAQEDFAGRIIETVPPSFTVTPLADTHSYSDVRIVSPDWEVVSSSPIILSMPFAGHHVTTLGFGQRIEDARLRNYYRRFGLFGHDGVDFDMPIGTPVLSVDDGKIVKISDQPYGNTVVIQHSWGKSYYGHLSEILAVENDSVDRGTVIAKSGNTGFVTAPHLHFGMKFANNNLENGFFGKIDPMPFLTSSSISLSDASVKTITWQVSLKKGEKKTIGFTYQIPYESPQFYLLGPLVLRSNWQKESSDTQESSTGSAETNPFILGVTTPSQTATGPIVYKEKRFWQIASDNPVVSATTGDEVLGRTRSSKLFKNPDGTYTVQSKAAALHYQDSGGNWRDIDATPRRIIEAGFDGWEVTGNQWHYRLGSRNGSDGWVGFGGRKGQNWLWFKLIKTGYLHYPTRSWQDLGGQPDYNRTNLTNTVQSLTLKDNTQLPVESETNWNSIFPNIDLRWKIIGGQLKEEIILGSSARSNIPAPATPAADTWFGFLYQVDWSDIPKITQSGIQKSINSDFTDESGDIKLMDASGNLLGILPIDQVRVAAPVRSNSSPKTADISKRFFRDTRGVIGKANTHYMFSGILANQLNLLQNGNLIFDPSVSTDVAETNEDGGSCGTNEHTLPSTMPFGGMWLGYNTYSDSACTPQLNIDVNGGWIFATSIPQGAIISSATMTLTERDSADRSCPINITLYGYDADSIADFNASDSHDIINHNTRTSQSVVDVIPQSGSTCPATWTSDSLTSIVQAIVNRAGFGGRIGITSDFSGSAGDYWYTIQDYTNSAAAAAQLDVTYSPPLRLLMRHGKWFYNSAEQLFTF